MTRLTLTLVALILLSGTSHASPITGLDEDWLPPWHDPFVRSYEYLTLSLPYLDPPRSRVWTGEPWPVVVEETSTPPASVPDQSSSFVLLTLGVGLLFVWRKGHAE